MGGAWSQSTQTEKQPAAPASPSPPINTLKRKFPPSDERVRLPDHDVQRTVKAKHESTVNKKEPAASDPTALAFDTTPDSETHRYVIYCKAIYWLNKKEIVKMLAKLPTLPPHHGVQKISKWDCFYISFPNRSCAEAAIPILSKHSYRGEPFEVNRAEHDKSAKRRRHDDAIANSSSAPAECITAADVTANWRDVDYDEQISRKTFKLLKSLREVTRRLKNALEESNAKSLPWLDDLLSKKTEKIYPFCCPIVDVLRAKQHSVARDYYRNKNEFTIGMSLDSCDLGHDYHVSQLTIGYSLGLVRKGQLSIGAVDQTCRTTGKLALRIAEQLTPVITALGMPIYDRLAHTGYWRQMMVRETMIDVHFIVVMGVNAVDVDAYEEEQQKWMQAEAKCQQAIVKALKESFAKDGVRFGIFWQASSSLSGASNETPLTHLYGIEVLHERMCGLTFRIQPKAFFQVNTIMAERLYGLIGELADIDKDTVVLDLCCGTGTIGLSLAERAHSVVGIEMNEDSVADALHNTSLNDIDNASFLVGKVEAKIYDAIKQISVRNKCVVILDPPRAGVHNSVIGAVRAMPIVECVVFVSCEPSNLWKNAVPLCRPTSKSFRLEPFQPVKAYGVDLFPHTNHIEMVTLFTRNLKK